MADQVTNESQSDLIQSTRKKTDPTWDHCQLVAPTGKTKSINCNYCDLQINGGGIHLMKEHLAGIRGQVRSCKKFLANVRFKLEGSIKEVGEQKNEKKRSMSQTIHLDDSDNEIGELYNSQSTEILDGKKQKVVSTGIASYMKAGGGINSSQPSVNSTLQSKKELLETDMAIALWFYDACIPLNAVNSPYFHAAISRIASMGHGYKAPSCYSLRYPLLREAKAQLQLAIDALRSKWAESGCTIMVDGWKDRRQRPLINFLVYCLARTSFIKSVDASDFASTAENLCGLFSDIVEMVGPKNVVHVVTDNASNYKKAGTLLNMKYPTIFWSPCSAHCINLIMKDIGELPKVKRLAKDGSRITVFVYNHKWPLAWLRRRPGWT